MDRLSSHSGRRDEIGDRSEIYTPHRHVQILTARLDWQRGRENATKQDFSWQISGERSWVLVGWRRCFLSSPDLQKIGKKVLKLIF